MMAAWLLATRSSACKTADHAAAVGRLRTATNFSHVFIIGDSFGGNLMHLVAAHAGEEGLRFLQPVRLTDVVLLHSGFMWERRVGLSRELMYHVPFQPLLPRRKMQDTLYALPPHTYTNLIQRVT
jgi:acetyl esterase/lipase